jgi:hypothetical protein
MGRTVADVLPEVVDQGFIELLDSVYAKGQPHVGLRTPLVLQNDDGTTRNSVIDFVYQPIFELDGSVSGIFVQGTDVTELDVVETAFRRNELQLRLARRPRSVFGNARSLTAASSTSGKTTARAGSSTAMNMSHFISKGLLHGFILTIA